MTERVYSVRDGSWSHSDTDKVSSRAYNGRDIAAERNVRISQRCVSLVRQLHDRTCCVVVFSHCQLFPYLLVCTPALQNSKDQPRVRPIDKGHM